MKWTTSPRRPEPTHLRPPGASRMLVPAALLTLLLFLGACTQDAPQDTSATTAESQQQTADAPPDQLPLPEIMRGLERDMAAVAAALWIEHTDGVAAPARRVADHPSVTVGYRTAIQEELGGGFVNFVQWDEEVHHSAVLLAERAEEGASIAELLELHYEVARGCVGCHTDYRSRLQPVLTPLRSAF